MGAVFVPGSLTDSGYPRQLKRWRRGTRLEDAPIVFEGQKTDVSVGAWVDHSPGFFREGFHREVAFFATDTFLLRNEHDAKALKIDVPRDAQVEFFRQFMTVQLRTPWTVSGTTYPAGALLAVPLDNFLQSNAAGKAFQMLFEPQPRQALQRITATRHALVLNVSDNVRGKVIELAPGTAGWQRREMRLPGQGTASASAVDGDRNDELWVHYQDFLTPPSLYHVMVGSDPAEPLKSLPALFDAGEMIVQQFEATSPDKTRVPYFVVGKREVIAAGSAPTILYGYGGFEIPLVPHYSGVVGRAWLERGGVYVLANIRGGGEFGPEWHQAAQKANRQRAFDDFEAVATDLVQRGITQTRHLGIMGGSNGGLLVSTVAIQRPELFHAVVCQVPLTDMRRFHKLLAGASWMAEYGDPDKPEDWAYLSKYSPYQNVRAQGKYPRMLLTTSTRDDRVHPAHARKLFAKMKDMGHDVLYFENTEGGHAGSANNQQRAKIAALEYTFFWNALR